MNEPFNIKTMRQAVNWGRIKGLIYGPEDIIPKDVRGRLRPYPAKSEKLIPLKTDA